MPKWLSTARNCFTSGGFSSSPIPVRVCAEQVLPQQQQKLKLANLPLQQPLRATTAKKTTGAFRCQSHRKKKSTVEHFATAGAKIIIAGSDCKYITTAATATAVSLDKTQLNGLQSRSGAAK